MSVTRLPSLLAVALVAATLAACSTTSEPPPPQPYTLSSSQVTLEGTITAIDKANRTVTIRGSEGNVFDFQASDAVRNFDQLEVGDVVALDYNSAVALEIQPAGTAEVGTTVQDSQSTATTGARPGGSASETLTVVAEVVAVDTAANTVTVRGPGGNVVTLDVFREELRARLGTLKAGDLLRTTFTEAVAVNIRPASQ